MNKFDLIVIGGGPSGIFSAITAAQRGFKVALLEKNRRIGNKILVAGSGKCNLTHEGKVKDFLVRYGEHGKFLKEALNKYSPEMLRNFFEKNGLPLTLVKETGKYFPETFSSRDVVDLLKKKLLEVKVEIIEEINIETIKKEDQDFILTTNKGLFYSKNLIIATGGKSYPGIGTTGDGYIFAKAFNHKIIPARPALAPIFIKNYEFSSLSGISFQNAKITIWKDNKKVVDKNGPLLLTHTNFSGPVILDNSRFIEGKNEIEINFLNKNYEEFNNEIISEINKNGKKTIKRFLSEYDIPERFIKVILNINEIKEELKLSELSKAKRELLVKSLVSNRSEISKVGGFEMAMVTTGGVTISEINAKTMESKLVSNLYFVGEVLDVDGDTGGFNIQAACSTGVLAGKSIKGVENE